MAATNSKTGIGNIALAYLGEPPVNDIDSPGRSTAAAIMAMFYDDARQFTLRAGPWRFALHRMSITRETATPAHSWDYQFAIPTRCLLIHQLGTDDYPLTINKDYKVEKGKILTNEEGPLEIVFIDDVTDVGSFPPDFKFALAAYLAHLGAAPILKSTDKATELMRTFEGYMDTASNNNALENPPKVIANSRWVFLQRSMGRSRTW